MRIKKEEKAAFFLLYSSSVSHHLCVSFLCFFLKLF